MTQSASAQLPNYEPLVAPTSDTVKEYRDTLSGIVEQLEHIKRMTRRYPVYLLLSGRSHKFDSPEAVDHFIECLTRGIAAFDSGKRARGINSQPPTTSAH
jgi:hypothetical protein